MTTTEPEPTTTFSARLYPDLAEPLKVLSARHGPRSRVITKIIERGVRRELQEMGLIVTNEDAGARQAREMA